MDKSYDIIVIGAGLTGLTTAYYLNKYGKNILVIETANRVGGVINTISKDGFVYESGPNTGVLGSPEIAELFEDLADQCKLEIGNDAANKRYILYKGKWVELAHGLIQGITTPLFKFRDKIKILGEPFRKPGNNEMETLAEMVERRMGKSFLDYAVDPFILGVYAGDPNYLVTKYALPKLYNLEQEYGSFIKGSIAKQRQKKSEREKKATRKIFSIEGGLINLTEALYRKTGVEKFVLGVENISVYYTDGEYQVNFSINRHSQTVSAKSVITTTPSYALPEILTFINENETKKLNNLYYAPVIEVALGFKKWNGIKLDGFGGLIPFKENRDILGVMYMSTLFKNRTPKGGVLITVFIGGVRKAKLTRLSDNEIKLLIKKEFKDIMGVAEFKPDLIEVLRYPKAIPQYGKESKERYEAIEILHYKFPGLIIGGNLHQGIGMSDRVKQGRNIADKVCNKIIE